MRLPRSSGVPTGACLAPLGNLGAAQALVLWLEPPLQSPERHGVARHAVLRRQRSRDHVAAKWDVNCDKPARPERAWRPGVRGRVVLHARLAVGGAVPPAWKARTVCGSGPPHMTSLIRKRSPTEAASASSAWYVAPLSPLSRRRLACVTTAPTWSMWPCVKKTWSAETARTGHAPMSTWRELRRAQTRTPSRSPSEISLATLAVPAPAAYRHGDPANAQPDAGPMARHGPHGDLIPARQRRRHEQRLCRRVRAARHGSGRGRTRCATAASANAFARHVAPSEPPPRSSRSYSRRWRWSPRCRPPPTRGPHWHAVGDHARRRRRLSVCGHPRGQI